jgi:hypothetical protein
MTAVDRHEKLLNKAIFFIEGEAVFYLCYNFFIKTTPKRLFVISLITIGTCLLFLLSALWIYKNYPKFYCPRGKHKAYTMFGGYYCAIDGAPEID